LCINIRKKTTSVVTPKDKIVGSFGVGLGDIRTMVELSKWYLYSAGEISKVIGLKELKRIATFLIFGLISHPFYHFHSTNRYRIYNTSGNHSFHWRHAVDFFGILGEHFSQVYELTRQQPLYIINKKIGF